MCNFDVDLLLFMSLKPLICLFFLKNWKVLNTIIGDIVIIKVSADNVICERPLMKLKFGIYCRKRY